MYLAPPSASAIHNFYLFTGRGVRTPAWAEPTREQGVKMKKPGRMHFMHILKLLQHNVGYVKRIPPCYQVTLSHENTFFEMA